MKICALPSPRDRASSSRMRAARAAGFDRQVAVEAKLLAVQTGRRKRQQQRGRSDQRNHADPARVRERDQPAPGIGDGGTAGFGKQPDAFAASELAPAAPATLRHGVCSFRTRDSDILQRPLDADAP